MGQWAQGPDSVNEEDERRLVDQMPSYSFMGVERLPRKQKVLCPLCRPHGSRQVKAVC